MPVVRDFMTKPVVTVDPAENIYYASKLMIERDIGGLVVTADFVHPIGIITKKDVITRVILQRIDPEKARVKEIMNKPLVTVNPETPLSEAAKLMLDKEISRLPVVVDGKLVGIITAKDISNSIIGTIAERGERQPTRINIY